MIIPIRCFTCGKLIADKWIEYEKRVNELNNNKNDNMKNIFKDLNLDRYCCKRMLLTHVDLITVISNNKNNEYNYDNQN